MTEETEKKLWEIVMNMEEALAYIGNKINNPYSSLYHDEELTHIYYILKGKSKEYEEAWLEEHKQRNMSPRR